MGKPFVDKTGFRYGQLTVLEYLGKDSYQSKPKWLCICDCGNTAQVTSSNLATGHTKSCGCFHKNVLQKRRKYSQKDYSEYVVWRGIKQRTSNPNKKDEKSYSHIDMALSWKNSFHSFLADMGKKPSPQHSIERIDNLKGYYPDNCVWGLPKAQANNRRNNKFISFNGITQTLQQWSDQTGIKAPTINARITRYGWSVHDALTKTVGN